MAELITCKGPNCEEIKKDTNHWWLISPADAAYFHADPFGPKLTVPEGLRPVCGDQCVLKLMQQWLSGNSRKKVAAQPVSNPEPSR